MNVISNKTLAYWKESAVTLRQIIAKRLGTKEHLKELKSALKHAYRRIEQIERKVLVCVLLLILVGGCATAKGIFQDVEWSAGKLAENIETNK